MNIVEVLRQAKPGQKIKRRGWFDGIGISNSELLDADNKTKSYLSPNDLTADDWEIVKRPRNLEFTCTFSIDDFSDPVIENATPPIGDKVPYDTPCKVTIEWEE